MSLLTGVNHVATITEDLDRLADFYGRVFDTPKVLEISIPSLGRHAFISIGGPATLHVWEVDGTIPSDFGSEIFDRGRVDHFALEAKSYEDFEELRRRLIQEGATKGEVNDFGVSLSFSFTDPDGTWAEVAWWKAGVDPGNLDANAFEDPIRRTDGACRGGVTQRHVATGRLGAGLTPESGSWVGRQGLQPCPPD